jgi:hypothetical protein
MKFDADERAADLDLGIAFESNRQFVLIETTS